MLTQLTMTKAKTGSTKPEKEKVAPATEENSTTTAPFGDTSPQVTDSIMSPEEINKNFGPGDGEKPEDKAPEDKAPEDAPKEKKSKAKKHGDIPEVGDKVNFVSPIGAVTATVTEVLNDLTVNLEHELGPQRVVQYGKQIGEWYW